ncbi:MAG: LemA family protein [Methanobacteriaceae archaeon]|jgi:LemA protein
MVTYIISGIILVILIILAVLSIAIYNSLIYVTELKMHGIDVQLKRRADLIPNLVETVKGYAKHERGVFENVTRARSSLLNAQTVQESAEANNMLTGALKSLFAVAENYPDLKANENFLDLQQQLSQTEDKIAYSRQFYNDTVLMYNKVQMFPSNIFAKQFNFKEAEFFEVAEAERSVPKVEF